MNRPSRVLWLPAIAVLLPCAFIGVLGAAWLRVEREAAGHRGLQAAEATADALRRDLETDLRAIADAMAPALARPSSPRPPFALGSPCTDLCSEIFVFDRAAHPSDLEDETGDASATGAGRRVTPPPEHRIALARIEDLERRGEIAPALVAATALLGESSDPDRRAPVLLVLARLSAAAGRAIDVERYAKAMVECCAAERDEFGMAFVLYAAWQRLRLSDGRDPQGARLAALADELITLVDRGYLGTESDVTTITLAARRAKDRGRFPELVTQVTTAHARIQARAVTMRAVSGWIGQVDRRDPEEPVIVRTVTHGPSNVPTAFAALAGGQIAVMPLDRGRVDNWIGRWARLHGTFEITTQHPPAERASAGLPPVPLFPDSRDVMLTLVPRGPGPTADSRARLLAIAVAGVLVLTFVVAFLAGRDVLRELRTSSMRSAFVASVTHELKTPLTSIRLLTETLRQHRARPESRDELLDTMTEEAERLGRLVDNVLSSSRIETGAQQYRPRIVSLPDAVRRALRHVEPVLQREGFTLVERLDDDRLPVKVDSDALDQVVLNLVGNAMKYSGEARHVEVSVGRHDGRATLSVADRGIGIARADHTRIFNRFYRTPEAIAHTTGAGLGLALVRHFADAHDGRVEIDSAPGRGSVFSVSLPIAPERT